MLSEIRERQILYDHSNMEFEERNELMNSENCGYQRLGMCVG